MSDWQEQLKVSFRKQTEGHETYAAAVRIVPNVTAVRHITPTAIFL